MDAHAPTACVCRLGRESEVTQEVRDTAKKLAYATLYGQGAEALGRELGIARWQAQNLISDFHGRYPGLKVFAEQTRASCRQVGHAVPALHLMQEAEGRG